MKKIKPCFSCICSTQLINVGSCLTSQLKFKSLYEIFFRLSRAYLEFICKRFMQFIKLLQTAYIAQHRVHRVNHYTESCLSCFILPSKLASKAAFNVNSHYSVSRLYICHFWFCKCEIWTQTSAKNTVQTDYNNSKICPRYPRSEIGDGFPLINYLIPYVCNYQISSISS